MISKLYQLIVYLMMKQELFDNDLFLNNLTGKVHEDLKLLDNFYQ